MLYGSRTNDDVLAGDELDGWAAASGGRFRLESGRLLRGAAYHRGVSS